VVAQRGPAPIPSRLTAEVIALACAPTLALEQPAVTLRVGGGQDSFFRRIYTPGDLVTINAGTRDGIEVGQEFFARRVQAGAGGSMSRNDPGTIRTTGWVKVYAVDDAMSLATISHACDTIEVGDYLEPFAVPAVVTASSDRPKAQKDNYGRVMQGQDRRRVFGKEDFFLVDRGSDHGVGLGTQFVLYRDKHVDGNFLFELGEAVAVSVTPEFSTLKVTLARDGIQAGDYVAMRR
jgi:hypothetical protein